MSRGTILVGGTNVVVSIPFPSRILAPALALAIGLFCCPHGARCDEADPLPEGALVQFGNRKLCTGESLADVRLLPDNERILVLGNSSLSIWNLKTGKRLANELLPEVAEPKRSMPAAGKERNPFNLRKDEGDQTHSAKKLSRDFELHPDGKSVLWLRYGISYRIPIPFDPKTPPTKLPEHREVLVDLSYAPDGTVIGLTAAGKLYSLDSDESEWTSMFGRAAGKQSRMHTGGNTGVVASEDDWVHVWDLAKQAEVGKIDLPMLQAACVSANGKRIAAIQRIPKGKAVPNVKFFSASDRSPISELHDPILPGSIVLSDDGSLAAAWNGFGSTVRIYLVEGGKLLHELELPGTARAVRFTSDGSSLATGTSNAGTIKMWDTRTGKLLGNRPGHTGPVCGVAYLETDRFASASNDRTVRVWDSKGRELSQFETVDRSERMPIINGGAVALFLPTPDGHGLITVSAGGAVREWNPVSGKVTPKGELPFDASLQNLARSPNGRILAVGSYLKTRLLDAQTFREVGTLDVPPPKPGFLPATYVSSLAFASKGRLVTRESNRNIRVWNIEKQSQTLLVDCWQTEAGQFKDMDKGVGGVAVSPDGKFVAAGFQQGYGKDAVFSVGVWEIDTGERKDLVEAGITVPISHVAYLPDGKCLIAVQSDGKILAYDLITRRVLQTFSGHRGAVNCLAVAPSGKTFMTGGADGTAIVWNSPLSKPSK